MSIGTSRTLTTLLGLVLSLACAMPGVAETADPSNDQRALLGRLELRPQDFDVKANRICIHDAGEAGTWTDGAYSFYIVLLLERGHGLSKEDLLLLPPPNVTLVTEVQPTAFLFHLQPTGDGLAFEADGLACFDVGGVGLSDDMSFGIGKEMPIPELAP